ncbi:putative mitochondrion protein [Meredithblackwellia eburnea MCA 4105]
MASWERLVRFVAKEDSKIHFGQAIDPEQDVGLAVEAGQDVKVHEVTGSSLPFEGTVDRNTTLTISELLSPLPEKDVGSIRCLGINFRKHVEEAGAKMPKTPVLFMKGNQALTGPGAIPVPKFIHEDKGSDEEGTEQLDYETELAVIISKDCKNVKKEDAYNYVLGYTCANDVTGRFHQGRQPQWNFAKGFDKFCPIGPVLVSHSAIGDPGKLSFKGSLNGEVKQESNTQDWIFPVPEVLEFLSSGTTIPAGSVILFGTPSGIGWFSKPKRLLREGDVFTVWHEKIGTLVNSFVFE